MSNCRKKERNLKLTGFLKNLIPFSVQFEIGKGINSCVKEKLNVSMGEGGPDHGMTVHPTPFNQETVFDSAKKYIEQVNKFFYFKFLN